MQEINYEKGLVTDVKNPEKKQIIIHLMNSKGIWNSNTAKDIIDKYPKALEDFKSYDNVELAGVPFSSVDDEIAIGTLVCTEEAKEKNVINRVPLLRTILRSCLKQVGVFCMEFGIDIIKIQKTDNTVLDADWKDIEQILKEELVTGYSSVNGVVAGFDFDLYIYEK